MITPMEQQRKTVFDWIINQSPSDQEILLQVEKLDYAEAENEIRAGKSPIIVYEEYLNRTSESADLLLTAARKNPPVKGTVLDHQVRSLALMLRREILYFVGHSDAAFKELGAFDPQRLN